MVYVHLDDILVIQRSSGRETKFAGGTADAGTF
jgi:hypothetical protein